MPAERDMITLPQSTPSRSLLLRAAALLLTALLPSMAVAQSGAARSPGTGKSPGPGSCASTASHGAITPQNINEVLQNEYSIWIVGDKHARAYNALTGAIGEREDGVLGVCNAEAGQIHLACHGPK